MKRKHYTGSRIFSLLLKNLYFFVSTYLTILHFICSRMTFSSSHMAMFNPITCNSFPMGIASHGQFFLLFISAEFWRSQPRGNETLFERERNLFLFCKNSKTALKFFAIRPIWHKRKPPCKHINSDSPAFQAVSVVRRACGYDRPPHIEKGPVSPLPLYP